MDDTKYRLQAQALTKATTRVIANAGPQGFEELSTIVLKYKVLRVIFSFIFVDYFELPYIGQFYDAFIAAIITSNLSFMILKAAWRCCSQPRP